jgi:hypothetical protein
MMPSVHSTPGSRTRKETTQALSTGGRHAQHHSGRLLYTYPEPHQLSPAASLLMCTLNVTDDSDANGLALAVAYGRSGLPRANRRKALALHHDHASASDSAMNQDAAEKDKPTEGEEGSMRWHGPIRVPN